MRRVVCTGLGLVSPLGNNATGSWKGLVEGVSGAGPITQIDTEGFASKFACEVKDWDASPYFEKKELRHTDRFLQFAVAAGMMAYKDAGFKDEKFPEDKAERCGIYVGAGLGGVHTIEKTYSKFLKKGARHGFSPYFVCDLIINMAPGLLSIRLGAEGPNFSHVSACSTGTHSIGEAMRAIQYGDVDVMLAGGCESTISVLGVGGFNAMRAMSTRNDDPTTASRPFDKDRDGFVIGEGAGILVLEELECAKARGARIYGELVGYAANSDAFHMTQPAPEGRGAQKCMAKALKDAKMDPSDVDYINAHGTSTPFNDKNETAAIKKIFGEHAKQLAVSSTKSMTGHALGGAGGIEAAICMLALQHNIIPPTINYTTPDPECDLDYVPNTAREKTLGAVLSNSFGFGGTNATLIMKRYVS